MNNPYDLHSWSQWYRQEAFREARVLDLIQPGQVVGWVAPLRSASRPHLVE